MRTRALLSYLCALTTAVGVSSAQCQVDKLVAEDGSADDNLATQVAMDGDRIVVGAPFVDLGSVPDVGAAYVFELTAGRWIQVAKLTASDGVEADRLAFSVAIDGDVVVAGARYDTDVGYGTGASYVFERIGGVWQETSKLLAQDQGAGHLLGDSVAVEGDVIAVGAGGHDNAGDDTGAVYVYERDGSGWSQTAQLLAQDPSSADAFGVAMDISGDRIAVGAGLDDDAGENSGSVYVFERAGTDWVEMAKLTGSSTAAGDRFGETVAIEGSRLVVGAQLHDSPSGDANVGFVYVFDHDGTSWSETAVLRASDEADSKLFGSSVALSGDRILVGAWRDNQSGPSSGAAYVFELVGGVWTQTDKMLANDQLGGDHVGFSLDVSGNVAAVGSRSDDDLGSGSGAVYVWSFVDTDCPALYGAPRYLDLSSGGLQIFTLLAGPAKAGDLYWVLGSATGTSPGMPGGVPLNYDGYTLFTIQAPNTLVKNSLGFLDANGRASASILIPGGDLGPALAGLELNHAFVSLNASSQVDLISNAERLLFVP